MASVDNAIATSNQISSRLKGYGSERDSALNTLKQSLGLDDSLEAVKSVRKTAIDTTRALTDLPTNVDLRTSGMPISRAQKARIVSSEATPITNQLRDTNDNLNYQTGVLDIINRQLADKRSDLDTNFNNEIGGLRTQLDTDWNVYNAQDKSETQARAEKFASDQAAIAQRNADRDYGLRAATLQFQKDQAKEAADLQKKGYTASFIQGTQAKAEAFANSGGTYLKDAKGNLVMDSTGRPVYQAYIPGSPEWQDAYDSYMKKNLTSAKSTAGSTGIDTGAIDSYLNTPVKGQSVFDILRSNLPR